MVLGRYITISARGWHDLLNKKLNSFAELQTGVLPCVSLAIQERTRGLSSARRT